MLLNFRRFLGLCCDPRIERLGDARRRVDLLHLSLLVLRHPDHQQADRGDSPEDYGRMDEGMNG